MKELNNRPARIAVGMNKKEVGEAVHYFESLGYEAVGFRKKAFGRRIIIFRDQELPEFSVVNQIGYVVEWKFVLAVTRVRLKEKEELRRPIQAPQRIPIVL
jgi:hypothetical protein